MSGHGNITLYTSLSTCDGAVLVYLEEETADGQVYHITEGILKASHRKLTEYGFYCEAVPQRNHTSGDKAVSKPDELLELKFDLLPMSWQFKKGSRIRISISGGDKDLFEIINPQGYELKIHCGGTQKSVLELPLVEK
jgi:predicted acyl esterase